MRATGATKFGHGTPARDTSAHPASTNARGARGLPLFHCKLLFRTLGPLRDDFGLLALVEFRLDLVVVADVDGPPAAIGELAEKKLLGQRFADGVLNESRHR